MIHINIVHSSSLDKEEIEYLEKMFGYEFGHIDIQWSTPEWYLIAKCEDKIIGRIGILRRAITVGREVFEVGGISGVIVSSEWRNKSISKLTMNEVATFIKDNLKLDFGLLLCRDEVVPVYEQCNWYIVKNNTVFSQSTGEKIYSKNTMVIECRDKKWPEGSINLNGLPW